MCKDSSGIQAQPTSPQCCPLDACTVTPPFPSHFSLEAFRTFAFPPESETSRGNSYALIFFCCVHFLQFSVFSSGKLSGSFSAFCFPCSFIVQSLLFGCCTASTPHLTFLPPSSPPLSMLLSFGSASGRLSQLHFPALLLRFHFHMGRWK